jgi:predicted SAM-dependent methyltransferase
MLTMPGALMKRMVPQRYYPQAIDLYVGCRSLALSPVYRGTEHECPFCGSRLRRFLPGGLSHPVLKERSVVGGGLRENRNCPICRSFDRERLVYLFLVEETEWLTRGGRLLHVAPERMLRRALQDVPHLDYLSADLASPYVMRKMDITAIHLEDGSFDGIICNHVLEHVPDDRKALSELCRVLKPGGWAILQVPISLSLQETYEDPDVVTAAGRAERFGQSDHVRIYGQDYQDRLAEAGFDVRAFDPMKERGAAWVQRYGLVPEEKLFVCSKPDAPRAHAS